MKWIKVTDVLTHSIPETFIRYDNGQQMIVGDHVTVRDIWENGWDDIEYLDESPSSDPAEVLQLRQWKKEATALLAPILEYGLKHPEIKLGQSATSFVLNRAKAAEVLVKALKYFASEKHLFDAATRKIATEALEQHEQLKQQ